MMTEMERRRLRLVPAIGRHRGPDELEGQDENESNKQSAKHQMGGTRETAPQEEHPSELMDRNRRLANMNITFQQCSSGRPR
jgi:hypothetical protein